MKKRLWLKRGALVFAAAFGVLQLTNPRHENPAVLPGHDLMASNAPPPDLAAAMHRSCYDCHSSETHWPWYSYVAPVSRFIVKDVTAARAAMNFSEWPWGDDKRIRKRWRNIAEDLESMEMPPPSYTRVHSDAQLTPERRAGLIAWARKQANEDP